MELEFLNLEDRDLCVFCVVLRVEIVELVIIVFFWIVLFW